MLPKLIHILSLLIAFSLITYHLSLKTQAQALLITSTFAHESVTENIKNIHMKSWGFDPSRIIITQGTTLVFENVDLKEHWPASNIHPTHEIYPEFDPKKPVKINDSWSFKFDKPGEWKFHDHLNPRFTGTIVVNPSTASAQPASLTNGPTVIQKIGSSWDFLKAKSASLVFNLVPRVGQYYLNRQNIFSVARKNTAKLGFLLRVFGPTQVMAHLYTQSIGQKPFNCHVTAHLVGRTAYQVLGDSALLNNITTCHSGYIHGSMGAFVKYHGTEKLSITLSNMCEKATSHFQKLTCYHATGHGFMSYTGNDLPESINRCSEYDSYFKQTNCYVGAFMENVGTETGDAFIDHPTIYLKKDDPSYPCSLFDNNYGAKRACYAMQPTWWRQVYHGDMTKAAEQCLLAGDKFTSGCFFGFGEEQEAAVIGKANPKSPTDLCSAAPNVNDNYTQCLNGVQTVFMDYWGLNLTKQEGNSFCDQYPPEYWENCQSNLENRLADLKSN